MIGLLLGLVVLGLVLRAALGHVRRWRAPLAVAFVAVVVIGLARSVDRGDIDLASLVAAWAAFGVVPFAYWRWRSGAAEREERVRELAAARRAARRRAPPPPATGSSRMSTRGRP